MTTITEADLFSYFDGIIDVTNAISVFHHQGFKNVVVPSRGVCPAILLGDTYASELAKNEAQLSESFVEHLKWVIQYYRETRRGHIWMPFTAQTGNANIDEQTADLRFHWCSVLRDVLYSRSSLPRLIYENTVRAAGNKYGHSHPLVLDDAGFVFVDTVVSGRAVSEILEAFDSLELDNFRVILIVGNDGNKLGGRYKARFDQLEAEGKLVVIKIANLFTEDQGPGFTFVTATIYPTLIERLNEQFSRENRSRNFAVGTLHMKSDRDICSLGVNNNRAILSTLFFLYVQAKLGRADLWKRHYHDMLAELNQNIHSHGLAKQDATGRFFHEVLKTEDVGSFEVSSSHVILANLRQSKIDEIVGTIKSQMRAH